MNTSGVLTVYFESPFWVGVYERRSDGALFAAKIVFGAEPKDYQVYEFLLLHWKNLHFSPPLKESKASFKRENPKRLQRNIHRQTASTGTGTKSQQALQEMRQNCKQEKKTFQKQKKDLEAQKLFDMKQKKRKEKHRGH